MRWCGSEMAVRGGRNRGSQKDRLPIGIGRYGYERSGKKPVRVRGNGFKDRRGNLWEWGRTGVAGIGERWDVQHPDGRHSRVRPDGEKHHGTPAQEYF